MILTSNQKRAIRRLWIGDLTTQEICDEMGWTETHLVAVAAFLELPARTEPNVYLPTPAEIRLECAKIRAGWSPAEREARLGRLDVGYREAQHARRSTVGDRSQGGEADAP